MLKGNLKRPSAGSPAYATDDDVGRAWLAPVAIAAFSASLMIIVATVESLPLRDPDARYVGSPLALIGVIAGIFLVLDLVPRSWRHSRETGTSLPASFVGVFEERWWGRRGLVVIVALLSFYVTYISYRNLKSFLPVRDGRQLRRGAPLEPSAGSSSATTPPSSFTTSSARASRPSSSQPSIWPSSPSSRSRSR